MLARFRPRRPSHGTVVAYVALFVALGGTTYAAATIGSGDIKKNAVLSRHIKDGEVRSGDLSPKLKASLKLHCPNGMSRAADTCFEFAARPAATWQTAAKTGARAQRPLPHPREVAF